MRDQESKRRAALLVLPLLLALVAAGCYSVRFETRTKQIAISSEPPGALIVKQDSKGSQVLGRAPVTLSQPYRVKVRTYRHWHWVWPLLLTGCSAGGISGLSDGVESNPAAFVATALCVPGAIATLILSIVGEARSGRTTPDKSEKVLVRGSLPGHAAVQRSLFVPQGAERLALQLAPLKRQAKAATPPEPAKSAAPPKPYVPKYLDAKPSPAKPGAQKKLIVAVFDVQDAADRFERKDLEQLTEYLSAKLTEVAGFRVVPRQQLRERLVDSKKEGYQTCYEESCQIELGKAVAAQKSLATKLLKIGNTCAISTTLFDLRSETAEAAASTRTGCSEEGLIDGMDRIVKQLARGSYR